MHHDETVFPEPSRFKPERFLTSKGKLILPGEHPRDHVMPFGAGVRACVGETLATTRIFLVITHLVQRFKILPKSSIEKQPSCHPHTFEYNTLLESLPYEARFIPRNP